jgi:hypothetical protein
MISVEFAHVKFLLNSSECGGSTPDCPQKMVNYANELSELAEICPYYLPSSSHKAGPHCR